MRPMRSTDQPGMNGADERAVSFTVGYVLTVAIAVLLVGGMFVSVGQVVGDERMRTIQAEAEVVGDQTAAGLMAADRLVQRGDRTNVSIDLRLPTRLAGQSYSITLRANATDSFVIVRTRIPQATVRTPVINRTPIENVTVAGSNIRVTYRVGGRLTIERGEA